MHEARQSDACLIFCRGLSYIPAGGYPWDWRMPTVGDGRRELHVQPQPRGNGRKIAKTPRRMYRTAARRSVGVCPTSEHDHAAREVLNASASKNDDAAREVLNASASKNDDAARVFPGFQVGEGFGRLVDLVAPGDQLVQLEPTRHVELQHAGKVDARHAGAEVAALQGFFLEHHAHRLDRGR